MTYETYAGNFPICSRLNEPVSEEVTPIKINDQLHAWLLINEPLRNDALGPGSGKIKYTVAIEVCIFSCIFLCSLGLFRPDLSLPIPYIHLFHHIGNVRQLDLRFGERLRLK
jgi:hypothetical protein